MRIGGVEIVDYAYNASISMTLLIHYVVTTWWTRAV